MTSQAAMPHPTLQTFAARLALIRWAQGWNQKEAALACGLPHSSWRQWEIAGSAPRDLVDVANKIAARTGYSDYWIMTGKEAPPGGPGGRDSDGVAPRPGLEPGTLWLTASRQAVRSMEVAA